MKRLLTLATLVAFLLLPTTAQAGVYGWWKLDEGSGDLARDSGPRETHGDIFEYDLLGLGDDGSVWVDDPERGTVLGVDGAYVEAGEIPIMTLDQDFTWSFWAKPDSSQTSPNNNIILGNRWGFDGSDTVPREFIKFTVNRFEYHMDAGVELVTNPDGTQAFLDDLQYLDCDFCPERHIDTLDPEWAYHTVVKDGDMLTYYRNGELGNTHQIETDQLSPDPLPFYMGGQNGAETWAGYLSDVRLWDHALTLSEVLAAMGTGTPGDFDGNGALDVDDINALLADITTGTGDTRFDVDSSGGVDAADVTFWIKNLKNSWIGDANLDGEFNSSDFVSAFTAGKYETGDAATWGEGDWNADGVFNSSDFVAAFTDGGYERGARPAVASVPEPTSTVLLALALLGVPIVRRRF